MANLTSYLVFWIVIFLILGAFWYALDRRYGVKFYRSWYRLTHEKPLPEGIQRGFIFNRKTRHKALMATLLSTAQTVVAVMSIEQPNLLVELILWIVEVPVTMLGFALGPWVYKLWSRRDEMFDAIDEIEAGKRSVLDLSKPKSKRADPRKATTPTSPGDPDGTAKRTPDDEDENDPRDMIRRYTKR